MLSWRRAPASARLTARRSGSSATGSGWSVTGVTGVATPTAAAGVTTPSAAGVTTLSAAGVTADAAGVAMAGAGASQTGGAGTRNTQ